jgi:hypothetical protein
MVTQEQQFWRTAILNVLIIQLKIVKKTEDWTLFQKTKVQHITCVHMVLVSSVQPIIINLKLVSYTIHTNKEICILKDYELHVVSHDCYTWFI